MHSRQDGTVKWFDERCGMGMISAEGHRSDYLVLRCSARNARFAAGERVSFEPVIKGLGNWAFNVIRQ
jgi:cold shock CspA family protein